MNLEPIIEALRDRAPSFDGRVFGAGKWAGLERDEAPDYPAAYVVPISEDPEEQRSVNGYSQVVVNRFAVMVLVSQEEDERGQQATGAIDSLEKEIFKAILNWQQTPKTQFSEIVFDGAQALYMDSARLIWQLDFTFETYLDATDTYQKVEIDNLPDLEGLNVDVDCIEPSSKKKQPDGHIEAKLKVDL